MYSVHYCRGVNDWTAYNCSPYFVALTITVIETKKVSMCCY